jgi:polysaccharide export outer membrane protein
MVHFPKTFRTMLVAGVGAMALTGCVGASRPELPAATFVASQEQPGEEYIIGPLDQLNIFVWRNPELSTKVQVRPDGRITTPLISDMPAVGKTPRMLADDMKIALGEYRRDDRGRRLERICRGQPREACPL